MTQQEIESALEAERVRASNARSISAMLTLFVYIPLGVAAFVTAWYFISD